MSDLVKRLRNHALPDPYDEREVMHAPLLREAADALEQLLAERDEWKEVARVNGNAFHVANNELAALKQKIDSAEPVLYGCKFLLGNRIDTFYTKSSADRFIEKSGLNGAQVASVQLYTLEGIKECTNSTH